MPTSVFDVHARKVATEAETDSIDAQRSLPKSADTNFNKNALLEYGNESTEAAFIDYMHTKLFIAIPIAQFFSALAGWLVVPVSPKGLFPVVEFIYTICFLVSFVNYVMFRRGMGKLSTRLAVERWELIFLGCVVLINSHVVELENFASNCTEQQETRIDTRKHYDDPLCDKWLTPFSVAIVAAFVALQITKFKHVVGIATMTQLIHLTFWYFFDLPNPLYQVWVQAIYVFAGLVFVCFVRREHERAHRSQFERFRKLESEREALHLEQLSVHDHCLSLIPEGMVRRLQRHDPDAPLDRTDNGCVVVAGIHEFGTWSVRDRPESWASAVVEVLHHMRSSFERQRLDVVAVLGDRVVATGGLVVKLDCCAARGCVGLLDAVHLENPPTDFPPLHGAVHIGALRGVFVGSSFIRYDVYGDAYEACLGAALEARGGDAYVSRAVADDCGIGEDVHEVTEVHAVSFGVLRRDLRALLFEATRRVSGMVVASDTGSNDGLMFAGIENLLARGSITSSTHGRSQLKSQAGDSSDTYMSGSDDHIQFQKKSKLDKDESVEALRERLARYSDLTTVACCFPRFAEDEVEDEFVEWRINMLPRAASRPWLAYAGYTTVILLMLISDLDESNPAAPIAVFILVFVICMACVLGTVPRVLGRKRMTPYFTLWSVAGVILPLFLVYGAALSRPAAIGNDVRLYMLLGAIVRSYCFTSSRWQAVIVPFTVLASLGQYLLPGAELRSSLLMIWVLVLATILGDVEREKTQRNDMRREVEERLVLKQKKAAKTLREGLMKSIVPRRLWGQQSGARMGFDEGSMTKVMSSDNASVMFVRCATPQGGATARTLAQQFDRLEKLVSRSTHLAVVKLFGDQAIIIGPLVPSEGKPLRQSMDAAFVEAVKLGLQLNSTKEAFTVSDAAHNPLLQPSAHDPNHQQEQHQMYSAVMDCDVITHALSIGKVTTYTPMGPSVTRLLSLFMGADRGALAGFVVTSVVQRTASQHKQLLDGVQQNALPPMKIRGAGVLRLTQLSASDDNVNSDSTN